MYKLIKEKIHPSECQICKVVRQGALFEESITDDHIFLCRNCAYQFAGTEIPVRSYLEERELYWSEL